MEEMALRQFFFGSDLNSAASFGVLSMQKYLKLGKGWGHLA